MISPARWLVGAAPLLLAALLPTACAVVPEVPPASPVDAEGLLNRLAASETAVRTVRGQATVRYDGPTGSGSVDQVIVVALPDRARLEALSPVGTAVLLIAIRGDDLTVHAPDRHEYGVGRATRETLARLARVPIPPGPLLRLLAGLPPLSIRPTDPRVRVALEADGFRVDSVDGPLWQRVWTGPGGTAVDHGELGEGAGPLVRFQFGGRRPHDGIAFPLAIRIEGGPGGTSVAVRYETVRLNEPVDAGLFSLPRPTDGRTRIMDLGGGAAP